MWRMSLFVLSWLSLAAASSPAPPVATRMRHVVFHLGPGIELRVDDLAGHLISKTANPVLFDDVKSYVVDIQSARVAMTPASLTNLMNNYVFASPDAPFKNIKIGIEGQEMTQSGTLRKGVPVPFSIRATLAATADGKIRVHPTAIKAAGFVSKRVLDFFGLELDNLVKMKNVIGVTVDGDDLLLDPQLLLPPPQIRGRLTRAAIEDGVIVQQFGPETSPKAIAPPNRRFTNYMYYRGGTLRFGKLTMRDTDLLLVDSDPKDTFDFSPEQYNDQLVAGYSKNTRAHGLIVYMPDLADLAPRSTRTAPAARSGQAETQDASRRRP
jgi:hypothetical protein